uniref:Uncharacterized protein n=1 Tax=Ralstonia solanacearum TaxID=305 RepID=A0A0S4XKM3_RALSL|nr:protein of unknown function [Ralstonia solanacearum]CUV36801.1 protein of unknown function [Ralstonia solanacearum]CUV40625.1 protein of unknown function [Ralstonia solanacearum]CUV64180.1 protein of unknown function [Ralstonia solanacearum]
MRPLLRKRNALENRPVDEDVSPR